MAHSGTDSSLNPLVAVIGPTGSGKSELALRVAEEFNGEIVNCDSLQLYRFFDIGTAKLDVSERRGVPHHLLDILDPDQIFAAGEYARLATTVIENITSRAKLPILAGGTGFYLRALLEGLFPGPARNDDLRRRLTERQTRRPGSIHRLLRRFDPTAARRIHPNDIPKTIRALEVCLLARRPVTELFQKGRNALTGYRWLKLGLSPDREELYGRLDLRCERMFTGGLIEEVQHILSLGYPPEAKPFESHGYKQTIQLLSNELNSKEALFYAQRNTRNYAKRQMTWFRREADVVWLRGFGSDNTLQEAALQRVREFLCPSRP